MKAMYNDINNIPQHFNDVMVLLEKKYKSLTYNIESLSYHNNIIGVIDKNVLVINEDNKKIKHFEKGVYNTYQIILLLIHKGDLRLALNTVREITGVDLPFVRVATDIFKVISTKDRYDFERTSLIKWNSPTLNLDYGKDAIQKVPAYDTFIIEPNNIDYESIVDNCYNMYAPFGHEPSMRFGEWKWIELLLRHVFGDQYELGLRYLQILYLYPKQPLPILVLVSEERETGKSTFIDFLDVLFSDNMVVINPQDIGSSFNDSYGLKNIIAIEESRFESRQTTEKLKNLATQKKILINTKNVSPYSVSFYGKLIITSNDEHKFSIIDRSEIRYWIRKLHSLNGTKNTNILNDLRNEIPYFLKSLIELDIPDFSRSRMVFTSDELYTKELGETKDESQSQLYKDLYVLFEDVFNNDISLHHMEFIPLDIKKKWFDHDNKYNQTYIKTVIKNEFKLIPGENRKYYVLNNNELDKRTGMAYTIQRDYFKNVKKISKNEKSEPLPF